MRGEARGSGSGLQSSSQSYHKKAGKGQARNKQQWTWSSVQASTSARGLNSYSSGRDAVTGLSLSDGFAAYGMRGLQQEGRKLIESKREAMLVAMQLIQSQSQPRLGTAGHGAGLHRDAAGAGAVQRNATEAAATAIKLNGYMQRSDALPPPIRLGRLSELAPEQLIQSRMVYSSTGARPCPPLQQQQMQQQQDGHGGGSNVTMDQSIGPEFRCTGAEQGIGFVLE